MKRIKLVVATMVLLGIVSITTGVGLQLKLSKEKNIIETTPYGYLAYNTEKYRYLSDIEYIKDKTSVGWGNILFDKNINTNINNGLITVNIDGEKKSFMKGVLAHATSTVVYDISSYNYDYFTAYLGVDASAGNNGNGVKFLIYTSKDGENWDLQTAAKPPVLKGTSESIFVKIDIKEAKYLKLYAHNNGNDSSDHAVYADAKLIKEDYVEDTSKVDFIKTVAEYDEIIKSKNISDQLATNELTILQREFVNSVGYDLLQSFVKYNDENKEAISWLMNDVENLRLYIVGGKPEGSYINSIRVLAELHSKYKADFENKEVTKYGTVLGDLYKKMAITLSLTHSKQVALWMQPSAPENQSNAVDRYAIYKKMHKDGHFVASESLDITKWFEEYSVEEMRFVLNNIIDDEEILWLNEYTQKQMDAHPKETWKYLTPHPYMAYVWPNYAKEEFHDPARKNYWDEKFDGIFSKYNVTYRNGLYKVWMNFRNEFGTGAVCGGISKTGSNIRAVHGIPAAVIGQPGHAAIVYYTKDAQGRGYWGIDNDVSGWTQSEKSERMLLGWGNASYTKGSYQVVYMALAQEVLNDYSTFEKSKEMVLVGQSYKGDLRKQEEAYRKALEIQPLNIDAWYELINVYNESENKTEEDYYNLAKELAEELKYFPLPMYQLTNLIKPKLTSVESSYKFTLLQTRILKEASVVPNNTTDNYYVYQPSITRTEANYLLGILDSTIASFSFDGEDAGKIVLSSRFDGNGVRWDYSLDGKNTWKEVAFTANEEHKLKLTEKELESISVDNDIYVHIVGVNYNEENLYKIDIKEQSLPSTIYNNDLENKVIGATDYMEWKMVSNVSTAKSKAKAKSSNGWTSFKDSKPDLTGDKTVSVRCGKHGVYLESEAVTLAYTKDVVDEKRKYISIDHLSIHSVSTQATAQGRHAKNAIDGNIYTNWHSAWNGSDKEKYIVIKLDEVKKLTALEYLPLDGGNGKIKNAVISVSMDGENWKEVVSSTNWAYNMTTKSVDFEPTEAQYIKIVGKETQSASSSNSFIAAKMFNLYEDASNKVEKPTAEIAYSTKEQTNQNVTVTLVNPSKKITITNNEGKDTYTFTENGTFTFEFIDEAGNKGSATATVDWIKKDDDSSNKPGQDDDNNNDNKPGQDDNKPGQDDDNNNDNKPGQDDNKPGQDDDNNNDNKPGQDDDNNNDNKPGQDDNNNVNKPIVDDNGNTNTPNDTTNTNKPTVDNNTNGLTSNKNNSINTEVPNTSVDNDIYIYVFTILIILIILSITYFYIRKTNIKKVEK